MPGGLQIDEQEARDIVRLIGEVAMSDGSRNDRRRALMDGLARLVGADSWLWFNAADSEVGGDLAVTFSLRSGLDDQQFAALMSMPKEPESAMLMEQFYRDLNAANGLTTRLQQQLFPMDRWKETKIYQMWKGAGIGPAILSACPNSQGQVAMVGLYRSDGREAFTERESRIVHITLSEIPALQQDSSSPELWGAIVDLSPRLREVLNYLVQGFDRKAIGSYLGLSMNTVGGYVADVYQQFDVHSQTELMHRFMVGDGGDQPQGGS